MTRTALAVRGLCLFLLAFNASADDASRIETLESQVEALTLRVAELEAIVSNSNAPSPVAKSGASKSVTNWRRLEMGMSMSTVRGILGEPERVYASQNLLWNYPNGGYVVFASGKLAKWSEPN